MVSETKRSKLLSQWSTASRGEKWIGRGRVNTSQRFLSLVMLVLFIELPRFDIKVENKLIQNKKLLMEGCLEKNT